LSSTGRLWLVDGTVNLRLLSYTDAAVAAAVATAVAAAVAAGCYWVTCAKKNTLSRTGRLWLLDELQTCCSYITPALLLLLLLLLAALCKGANNTTISTRRL
jgi:hypothetical protein